MLTLWNFAWDRHFKRVVGYARPSDYLHGAVAAGFAPAALLTMERFAPSHVGKGGFAPVMRLAGAIGLAGGFLYFYQRSSRTFCPISIPVDTGGLCPEQFS